MDQILILDKWVQCSYIVTKTTILLHYSYKSLQ